MARGSSDGHSGRRGRGDGRGRSSSSGASSQASDGGIRDSVAQIQLAGGSGSAPTSLEDTVPSSHSSTGRIMLTITPQGQVRNPNGFNWKATQDDAKNLYFMEFKKHFMWDDSIEQAVKLDFMKIAARRYKDFVYEIKMANDDPKKGRPPFIHEREWSDWLSYWRSEAMVKKSETAKKCRMSEPEGPGTGQMKHKGGSKSTLQIADEIAKKKGVDPSQCFYDAYEVLHVNKDGSYTDPRSETVGRKIEELREQQSQPVVGSTEPQEVDMAKIYHEAVGGLDKKKRLFGVGSLASTLKSDGSSGSSHARSSAYDDTIVGLQNELQKERDERRQESESFRAHLLAQHEYLTRFCAQSGLPPPSPPPPL
ncbi:uncharacterized protein LOC130993799 [Salvia miltiorrhiza]|uniref:uncharacterized protein LOC130993799 n=1 Tax=Salvia miltiorrhiza TaxID=226208 RepID=UPI0025ABA53C|nr:uncharacterized protein LOC130993799 [Salvia miltiorrhiza]